jgi:hypothetical protein
MCNDIRLVNNRACGTGVLRYAGLLSSTANNRRVKGEKKWVA